MCADLMYTRELRIFSTVPDDVIIGRRFYNNPSLITATICSWKHIAMVQQAVGGFRACYPDVPLIVVDDGGKDASTTWIRALPERDEAICAVIRNDNRGHGPALHRASQLVKTPYWFCVDSDTQFTGVCGYLEAMLAEAQAKHLYAIGREHESGSWYIHISFALYDILQYRQITPFVADKSPACFNMSDAGEKGFGKQVFDYAPYAFHPGNMTRVDNSYWQVDNDDRLKAAQEEMEAVPMIVRQIE